LITIALSQLRHGARLAQNPHGISRVDEKRPYGVAQIMAAITKRAGQVYLPQCAPPKHYLKSDTWKQAELSPCQSPMIICQLTDNTPIPYFLYLFSIYSLLFFFCHFMSKNKKINNRDI
jgi:hypothetical protein